jgi:hypothetical protein
MEMREPIGSDIGTVGSLRKFRYDLNAKRLRGARGLMGRAKWMLSTKGAAAAFLWPPRNRKSHDFRYPLSAALRVSAFRLFP